MQQLLFGDGESIQRHECPRCLGGIKYGRSRKLAKQRLGQGPQGRFRQQYGAASEVEGRRAPHTIEGRAACRRVCEVLAVHVASLEAIASRVALATGADWFRLDAFIGEDGDAGRGTSLVVNEISYPGHVVNSLVNTSAGEGSLHNWIEGYRALASASEQHRLSSAHGSAAAEAARPAEVMRNARVCPGSSPLQSEGPGAAAQLLALMNISQEWFDRTSDYHSMRRPASRDFFERTNRPFDGQWHSR